MITNDDKLRDSYLSLACEYEKLADVAGKCAGGRQWRATEAVRPQIHDTRRITTAMPPPVSETWLRESQ